MYDGEVVFANDGYWASLIIKFSINGIDYYAVYGHSEINSKSTEVLEYEKMSNKITMSFQSPYVGMPVKAGQIVGLLWDHFTENAHLHFEIRSSAHPSPDDGASFCGYCAGKTKSDIEKTNRDPLAFIFSDGFIDGTCKMLCVKYPFS